MRWIKLVAAATAAFVVLALGAAGAEARSIKTDPSGTTAPAGMRLSPRQAFALATATRSVRDERAKGPLRPELFYDSDHTWIVDFIRGPRSVVEVVIDDPAKSVTHVFTGPAASTVLARGEHGASSRRQHLYLFLAGLVFLLPFVDIRRPLRMLHADLLVMVAGLGAYHWFFARGDVETAVPLVYPLLVYLLVRVLWIASHDRERTSRLVPHWPLWLLIGGLVAVVAARIWINAGADFGVRDGGYDSVWGAATIRHGDELYAQSAYGLNGYGPTLFLSYVPFELLFPFNLGGARGGLGAAHAATISFDLATIAGLVVLGRRLRPGRDGTLLGVALAYAFATYPWTVAVMAVSTNDGLVPALLVWALVAADSAPIRGALLGWATAAKFFPLFVIPPLARSEGDGMSTRSVLAYGATAAAVILLSVFAFLPHPGGLNQFLDLTVRYQLDRETFLSIWKLHPSLEPLRLAVQIAAVILSLVLAFVPRRRDVVTLAAVTAAAIVVQQLTQVHWYYLYASWFAPFVLIVFFVPYAALRSDSAPHL